MKGTDSVLAYYLEYLLRAGHLAGGDRTTPLDDELGARREAPGRPPLVESPAEGQYSSIDLSLTEREESARSRSSWSCAPGGLRARRPEMTPGVGLNERRLSLDHYRPAPTSFPLSRSHRSPDH